MYTNSSSDELLVGLKRHLLIAQDTTQKKSTRRISLENVSAVLEFVLTTQSIDESSEILIKFFNHLYKKVVIAQTTLDTNPTQFDDEVVFITMLYRITV